MNLSRGNEPMKKQPTSPAGLRASRPPLRICENSRSICAHSRSFFFNANGREYPQMAANQILWNRDIETISKVHLP
jgi:hypothetical protein